MSWRSRASYPCNFSFTRNIQPVRCRRRREEKSERAVLSRVWKLDTRNTTLKDKSRANRRPVFSFFPSFPLPFFRSFSFLFLHGVFSPPFFLFIWHDARRLWIDSTRLYRTTYLSLISPRPSRSRFAICMFQAVALASMKVWVKRRVPSRGTRGLDALPDRFSFFRCLLEQRSWGIFFFDITKSVGFLEIFRNLQRKEKSTYDNINWLRILHCTYKNDANLRNS